MKLILLLLMIGSKVLLTKLFAVCFIILSFLFKEKLFNNGWKANDWHNYFVNFK